MKPSLHTALLTLSLSACGGARAQPAAPAPAPTVSVATDAGAAPVEAPAPVDPARAAVLDAWRAANPQVTGSPQISFGPMDFADPATPGARVVAVVSSSDGASLVMTAVPFAAGRSASVSLSIAGAPEGAVTGMAVRDVNGDHHPDVAVFLSRESVLEGYLPIQRLMLLYTAQAQPELNLAPMIRAELELLGVRDDGALAAALPGLGAYEPPAAGMSPARFLARLRYATPAQLRQATASTGLRLCTDLPDRSGTRRKRCVTHAAARLTDALLDGRVRRDLGRFVEVLTDDTRELTLPSCQQNGAEVQCNANAGGPIGVNWSFVGEGASLRLIEVSPWAESS